MKVCILTGGGDAPGLNAVIRGFVKRAMQHGIEVYGSEDGFEGLLSPDSGLLKMEASSLRGILPKGGSILGCSNRANPFAMRVSKESDETRDCSADVVAKLRTEGIDALVVVGGDGTMHYAQRFEALGVQCIGVPKTIDNDLQGTDQTFGFETAVNTATWAIDALHSTAEAHARVMILEVMGRYAGWIALAAGMAGGADVILIPEIPYDLGRVVAKIRGRASARKPFSVIVIAEGAKPMGGGLAEIETKPRPGQLRRLGGAGERLATSLADEVDHEIRTTVLGHIQRGGSPSAFDRVLGMRFGVHAADCCAARTFGRMVVLRGTAIETIPLADVGNEPRLVDPAGQLVSAARAVDIELGAAPM